MTASRSRAWLENPAFGRSGKAGRLVKRLAFAHGIVLYCHDDTFLDLLVRAVPLSVQNRCLLVLLRALYTVVLMIREAQVRESKYEDALL